MVVTELPTAPLLLLCKNNKTKTGQSDSSAHLSPLHPPAGIKITKTYSYPITISAHAGFFFWHISWKKYSVWVEFSEEISAAVINRYEIREAAKHWEFSNARRHLDYCVCVCGRRGPPVVGSEAGSQSDARLSFLQAGGRVHAAGAAGARVRGESSRLVVLNGGKQTVITPWNTAKHDNLESVYDWKDTKSLLNIVTGYFSCQITEMYLLVKPYCFNHFSRFKCLQPLILSLQCASVLRLIHQLFIGTLCVHHVFSIQTFPDENPCRAVVEL